jgi:sigma-E factor negative regulatory protein RseB
MVGRVASARARRFVWTLALAAAAATAVRAQPGGAVPQRTDAQWLQAIQTAAQRMNYSGTIFYQQGADLRVSRIVHLFDGSVSHERLQMLDGEQREFVRRGDEVQCLIPAVKRVIVERRPTGGSFPALSTSAPADILRHYSLRLGAVERVADAECQLILLEPKDGLRFGYRLWVERSSGLLLRAQLLNDRQEVLEQIAFTEVRIGEPFELARLRPSWPTEGWRVDRVETRRVDLKGLGWTLTAPEGFRQLSAAMRRIARSNAPRDTIQAVYSDGLATFSVFFEADAGGSGSAAAHTKGPINAFARRVGDTLVTVVGEVPAATVRDVAMSVEARPAR